MSQENVELLRRSFEAFNRGDVESMLSVMDQQVRFACQFTALEGTYVGHEGVREFLADLAEVAANAHVENVDYRDLGDRVLALGDARATALGSGIPMDGTLAVVATFLDGRMTEYEDFGDRSAALAAAGVDE